MKKMKKTLSIIALTAACTAAGAQTMGDALNFSANNYYGTARSMGMGNALTAVGGDLGSIGLNPAGSAVAGYSQFTLTPGLGISSSVSSYSPSVADGEARTYGAGQSDSKAGFVIPNIGATFRFDTGRDRGVKTITLGIMSNLTRSYLSKFGAAGKEGTTSMFGAFAAAASCNADGSGHMMDPYILSESNFYNTTSNHWNYISAYDAGTINYNTDSDEYYGSTEYKKLDQATGKYSYFVPGTLKQTCSNYVAGTKNDIVINLGFNVSDRFYFGFNLGLPMARYRSYESYREAAVNPSEFPITPEYISSKGFPVEEDETYFVSGSYQYSYNASLTGVYFKAGAIWLPTGNLRLGLAVQTPTAFIINENWQVAQTSNFDNSDSGSTSTSPLGSYSYRLRTPYIINAGLAWTFGSVAMLSFDYELNDFSVMKFMDRSSGNYDEAFYRTNRLCNLFCGAGHEFRIGGEVNVNPALKLRAGVNIKTDPERYWIDSDGDTVDASFYDMNFDYYEDGFASLVSSRFYSNTTMSYSIGIGYNSPGSFFMDLGARLNCYPKTYYSPYSSYLTNDSGKVVYSPEIRILRKLWDVVLTFGWRF